MNRHLKYLLLLITSIRGRAIAIQAALLAGMVVFLIAYKLSGINGETSFFIAAWAMALTGWVIDHMAALLLNKSMNLIQTALPDIKETGGALPDGKTVRTIRHMVAASNGPVPPPPAWIVPRQPAEGVPEPTLGELHLMRGNLLKMVSRNTGLLQLLREELKNVGPDIVR